MKRIENHWQYDSWEEAFELCRELSRPIIVEHVGDERGKWQIYPSGRKETLSVHNTKK